MALKTFGRRYGVVVAIAAMVSLLVAPSAAALTDPAAGHSWSHRDAHVCSPSAGGQAACTSIARVLYRDGTAYYAPTVPDLRDGARATASISFSAVGIRTAYGIVGQGDPSRVIAIVDAYDDPNASSHLTTYRSGESPQLPTMVPCTLNQLTGLTSTASNPCFTKVNQAGGTTLPSADSGWSNEIDLDLQAASAICPMCSILLLEANSSSFSDLGTAVTTASNTAHVRAISNSYGTQGDVAEILYPAWDNAAKKGIAVLASAGDWGYGTSFPASSSNVLGIGGTTLAVDGNTGVRTAETVWSSTGSGCSSYNSAPSWQVIPGSPCGTLKAVADISADADPNSGLQIYTTYSGITGWWIFGGTSLSSPLLAALYAMQGGSGGSVLAGQYAWAPGTPYFDVTSGSNGTCSASVMCTAGPGWDGPTGRGSIAVAASSPVLTTINVSPASTSVQTGKTQQFTATGYDQFNNPISPQPAFTWSVGGGGTISASGLFTAGSTAGGPFTVTASSGSVNGTASVTVTAAPVLTTITVAPASTSVKTGGTQQFSATGLDQFGKPMSPQPAFTWSVSGGGTISASGLFTAGSTAGGPFTVTASSGSVNGTASVTVTSAPPDFSLSVSPTAQSVRRGNTATYTVTITPANGFSGSVTLSLTGQPTGSTVIFTPSPATGSSTLTIRTQSTTSRRTYSLTIKGVSGSLSHTTSASLTVTR
jgi:subtilase family serine protease